MFYYGEDLSEPATAEEDDIYNNYGEGYFNEDFVEEKRDPLDDPTIWGEEEKDSKTKNINPITGKRLEPPTLNKTNLSNNELEEALFEEEL